MYTKLSRRSLLGAAAFAGMAGQACAQTAQNAPSSTPPAFDSLQKKFGNPGISTSLALEVLAQTGRSFDMGSGANGRRRLVEITGGSFRGTGISGSVLPGGTDRQLFRSDGIRELDARYELQADDGALIFVHNKVMIDSDRSEEQGRYARSVVRLEAPEGPHDWLNRRLIIGTLDSLRPELPYVYLRFYIVD